jgi:hypothetical protein
MWLIKVCVSSYKLIFHQWYLKNDKHYYANILYNIVIFLIRMCIKTKKLFLWVLQQPGRFEGKEGHTNKCFTLALLRYWLSQIYLLLFYFILYTLLYFILFDSIFTK